MLIFLGESVKKLKSFLFIFLFPFLFWDLTFSCNSPNPFFQDKALSFKLAVETFLRKVFFDLIYIWVLLQEYMTWLLQKDLNPLKAISSYYITPLEICISPNSIYGSPFFLVSRRRTTLLFNNCSNLKHLPHFVIKFPYHCVRCVQIRSYFWSVFSGIRTRYNSVFGHFSRSAFCNSDCPTL